VLLPPRTDHPLKDQVIPPVAECAEETTGIDRGRCLADHAVVVVTWRSPPSALDRAAAAERQLRSLAGL